MKMGIVGSRGYNDYGSFYLIIDELRKSIPVSCIVSGGEAGVDTMASLYAKNNGIELVVFEANWGDMSEPCVRKVNSRGKEYSALAGINRNTLIVQESDIIVAFWDLKSKGTRDTIKKARDLKKELIVYNIGDVV